jgi:hypothetical protein
MTTWLVRPARRSRTPGRRPALISYLRDHLGGADAAVLAVRWLVSDRHSPQDDALFRRLASEFEEDCRVLRDLLRELGASGRSLKRVAGVVSGAVLGMPAPAPATFGWIAE